MAATAWWSWLFLVLLVAGLALVTVVLVRLLAGTRPGAAPRWDAAEAPARPTARDILDERYARGELDAAEYDERLRRLLRPSAGEGE
jgi:putative membrane protein